MAFIINIDGKFYGTRATKRAANNQAEKLAAFNTKVDVLDNTGLSLENLERGAHYRGQATIIARWEYGIKVL